MASFYCVVTGCTRVYRQEVGLRRHLLHNHHARLMGGRLIPLTGDELARRLENGRRGRLSGPQRRRERERSVATGDQRAESTAAGATAECRRVTENDVDSLDELFPEWPELPELDGDALLDLVVAAASEGQASQPPGEATAGEATNGRPTTAEAEVQTDMAGVRQGTQTESEFIDGTSGLPAGLSLEETAAMVREMGDATTSQIVARLLHRHGNVAESQRRELMLIVGAITFAQRDLVRYLYTRYEQVNEAPARERQIARRQFDDIVTRLRDRPCYLDRQ